MKGRDPALTPGGSQSKAGHMREYSPELKVNKETTSDPTLSLEEADKAIGPKSIPGFPGGKFSYSVIESRPGHSRSSLTLEDITTISKGELSLLPKSPLSENPNHPN